MLDTQNQKKSSQEEIKEEYLTPRQAAAKKLKKFMEEESKMVRGRFRSYKNPGAFEKVTFKKYPTPAEMRERGELGGVQPFEKWMKDNEIYEVPLYVARFLNGTDITAESINGKTNFCSYPVHSFLSNGNELATCVLDSAGIPVPAAMTQKFERRFGFESLEFGS